MSELTVPEGTGRLLMVRVPPCRARASGRQRLEPQALTPSQVRRVTDKAICTRAAAAFDTEKLEKRSDTFRTAEGCCA